MVFSTQIETMAVLFFTVSPEPTTVSHKMGTQENFFLIYWKIIRILVGCEYYTISLEDILEKCSIA